MALTPEDELKQKKAVVEDNLKLAEDILKKAEKYERLKGNPDWEGVLEDVKVLIGIHGKQIENALSQIVDVRPTGSVAENKVVYGRDDWFDFILQHQVRKEQLMEGLNEQSRILEAAELARKSIPILQKQLDQFKENSNA